MHPLSAADEKARAPSKSAQAATQKATSSHKDRDKERCAARATFPAKQNSAQPAPYQAAVSLTAQSSLCPYSESPNKKPSSPRTRQPSKIRTNDSWTYDPMFPGQAGQPSQSATERTKSNLTQSIAHTSVAPHKPDAPFSNFVFRISPFVFPLPALQSSPGFAILFVRRKMTTTPASLNRK